MQHVYYAKNGLMKIKKDDKVTIKGTDTTATVLRVSKDGVCQVRLDNPSSTTLRIHLKSLVPFNNACESKQQDETEKLPKPHQKEDNKTGSSLYAESTQNRGESGRFVPGGTHPYYPANPANREKVATARSLRQSLTQGMAELVDALPGIIGTIEEPEKKASAINATLRIILPQYSSIKFSDAPPRQLNAEQQLAKMKEEFLKSQKG